MDGGEKLERLKMYKEKGNAAFKSGIFDRASRRYKGALDLVEYDTDLLEGDHADDVKAIKLSCYLNTAACQLKLKG